MRPGTLVGNRFEVESLAGEGGMGAVYRAIDRVTGRPVAVKVLLRQNEDDVRRFVREARVLATVTHPGIVEYVAQGVTDEGVIFLAMEWLDGEDLGQRAERGRLAPEEALLVARKAAEALAAAHAKGIVHRDLKPSNLFLVGGDTARVKVLDFGIAHVDAPTVATQTGLILGTPGYMAPEQVRGESGIDARADVFSLGAVIFEMVAGRPPFTGDRVMAILAKVLFEEVPRLRSLVPDVPAEVDELLARMLSKSAADRPADAAAVLRALEELPVWGEAPTPVVPPPEPPPAIGTSEQRLVWVLFVGGAVEPEAGKRLRASREMAHARTLPQIAANLGMDLQWLIDGSAVLVMRGSGSAIDQAVRAARAALEVQNLLSSCPIGLAAGRAVWGAQDAIGPVIDRAASLLHPGLGRAGIRIDDVTAGLVEARFEVEAGELLRERPEPSGGRILGRATPFVGRDDEMTQARAQWSACIREPTARALVVVAPPGVGKSRLARELVAELAARPERPRIWTAYGDPVGAGAPFRMLAEALREALAVRPSDPIEERRSRLLERLGDAPERERVASFLGELAASPFPAEEGSQLHVARQDAILMGDQMRRAFEDFLEIETRRGPVVLVLEDLHWGDAPTVSFVGAALRNLQDRPLFVLALARPEIDARFPRLWADRRPARLELRELGRSAAATLVRALLGDVDEERMSRILETAAGNAFFLEEIVRAEALHRGKRVPGTVLAMVQARIEEQEPALRQVLRAASVFGRSFWVSGVGHLLGGQTSRRELAERLGALEALELVRRVAERRFAREDEWSFRSAIIREAAYSTLTEEDRRLGHRLVAQWLHDRSDEADAALLAEHHEAGGEPALAVRWWNDAAEKALAGNDFAGVGACVARAVACGATGEELGALRELEAQASWWRGDYEAAERAAESAIELVARRRPTWYAALGTAAGASFPLGHKDKVSAAGRTLAVHQPAPADWPPYLRAAARVAPLLYNAGDAEVADALMRKVEVGRARSDTADPSLQARVRTAMAVRAKTRGDAYAYLANTERAVDLGVAAGDLRYACLQGVNGGFALLELGQWARAAERLLGALAGATRLGLSSIASAARLNLGLALGRLGQWDQGAAELERAMAELAGQGNRRLAGSAAVYLARLALDRGDPTTAEQKARAAIGILGEGFSMRPYALATLARALLSQDRIAEATDLATDAANLLSGTATPEGEAFVRLVHAESLAASGDAAAASAALAIAAERMNERAARVSDEALRASFLESIPEHARITSLSRKWTGS